MGDYERECTIYVLDGTDDVALVTHVDQDASNGVVHAIDKVLIPPVLRSRCRGSISSCLNCEPTEHSLIKRLDIATIS